MRIGRPPRTARHGASFILLGQASARVTLDTYADLFDDDLDAVAVANRGGGDGGI